LLANEELGVGEEEAVYLGEGQLEDRRGEPLEMDFAEPGLWIPSGSDRSAHQYVRELLLGDTDKGVRMLVQGALDGCRRMRIEGEYAASVAVRAWQVVYGEVGEADVVGDLPAGYPVVVEVRSSHVLAFLHEPYTVGLSPVRVRFKLMSQAMPVNSLRFLP
jgi:hypothetical protein